MSIEHWMTFGTFAEQRHFIYPDKKTYSGVIINANMAAHAPAGLAAFLLEKTKNLPYLIDPLTHAFQHDPSAVLNSDDEVKSSIKTLAESYGPPISVSVGQKPILPEDLSDKGVLKDFVKNCVKFQNEQIGTAIKENKVNKYLDESEKEHSPKAVIAPYFFMDEVTVDYWLEKNVEAIKVCLENASNVFGTLVISQGVLINEAVLKKIKKAYGNLTVQGFVLWVDNFEEQTASLTELKSYLSLCRELRKRDRELINSHGGFFSILAAGKLGENALTGVAHGPEFGEFRGVVPVGGGIPIAKYYVKDLHARIKFKEAIFILKRMGALDNLESYFKLMCNCAECKKVLDNNIDNFTLFGEGNPKLIKRGSSTVRMEYPTTETKLRCLRHYLQCKKKEYKLSSGTSKSDLLTHLEESEEKFKNVLGLEAVSYLNNWAKAFN